MKTSEKPSNRQPVKFLGALKRRSLSGENAKRNVHYALISSAVWRANKMQDKILSFRIEEDFMPEIEKQSHDGFKFVAALTTEYKTKVLLRRD